MDEVHVHGSQETDSAAPTHSVQGVVMGCNSPYTRSMSASVASYNVLAAPTPSGRVIARGRNTPYTRSMSSRGASSDVQAAPSHSCRGMARSLNAPYTRTISSRGASSNVQAAPTHSGSGVARSRNTLSTRSMSSRGASSDVHAASCHTARNPKGLQQHQRSSEHMFSHSSSAVKFINWRSKTNASMTGAQHRENMLGCQSGPKHSHVVVPPTAHEPFVEAPLETDPSLLGPTASSGSPQLAPSTSLSSLLVPPAERFESSLVGPPTPHSQGVCPTRTRSSRCATNSRYRPYTRSAAGSGMLSTVQSAVGDGAMQPKSLQQRQTSFEHQPGHSSFVGKSHKLQLGRNTSEVGAVHQKTMLEHQPVTQTAADISFIIAPTTLEPRLIVAPTTPKLSLNVAPTTPKPSLLVAPTTPKPSLIVRPTTPNHSLIVAIPKPSLIVAPTTPEPSLIVASTTPEPSLTVASTTPVPCSWAHRILEPSSSVAPTSPEPSLILLNTISERLVNSGLQQKQCKVNSIPKYISVAASGMCIEFLFIPHLF